MPNIGSMFRSGFVPKSTGSVSGAAPERIGLAHAREVEPLARLPVSESGINRQAFQQLPIKARIHLPPQVIVRDIGRLKSGCGYSGRKGPFVLLSHQTECVSGKTSSRNRDVCREQESPAVTVPHSISPEESCRTRLSSPRPHNPADRRSMTRLQHSPSYCPR